MTPVINISEVLVKPTGTLVIHVLLAASYLVIGAETVLSAIIFPAGIGVSVTVGEEVILLKVTVPKLNKR